MRVISLNCDATVRVDRTMLCGDRSRGQTRSSRRRDNRRRGTPSVPAVGHAASSAAARCRPRCERHVVVRQSGKPGVPWKPSSLLNRSTCVPLLSPSGRCAPGVAFCAPLCGRRVGATTHSASTLTSTVGGRPGRASRARSGAGGAHAGATPRPMYRLQRRALHCSRGVWALSVVGASTRPQTGRRNGDNRSQDRVNVNGRRDRPQAPRAGKEDIQCPIAW